MRDLKVFLVVAKQLAWLGSDAPGLGGGAIDRSIHSLTCSNQSDLGAAVTVDTAWLPW